MKKYIMFFVLLMFTDVAYADDCNWDNEIPCVTIFPNINNSNALGDKITLILNRVGESRCNSMALPGTVKSECQPV